MAAFHEAGKLHPSHLLIVCHITGADIGVENALKEALEHHRLSKHVPLLFIVSHECEEAIQIAVQSGADEIVEDSVDHAALRQTIRDVRAKVRARNAPPHLPYRAASREIHQAGCSLISIFNAAQGGDKIGEAMVSEGAEAILDMTRRSDIRVWVNLVRNHDNATYQHCLLVAGFVADFARRLSLSLTQQHALAQAALLHDIGKVGIPTAILNKPTNLSTSEKALLDQHPVKGYNILARQGFDHKPSLSIARHHHEYLDGSGYPDKLVGAQISEQVRIATICDIFAALVERRMYKSPLPANIALSSMLQLGSKLDSGLIDEFSKAARSMAI